jgi:hypothetical protein
LTSIDEVNEDDSPVARYEIRLKGVTYTDIEVYKSKYNNGTLSVALIGVNPEWGPELITTASINLTVYDFIPSENCFFVKNYLENEGLAAELECVGIAEPTGVIVNWGISCSATEMRLI